VNAPRIDDSQFALVGGVMVPQDPERFVCKFCGAVFEARTKEAPDVGVKNHERQCRAKTRAMWTSAALQNAALVEKGPQAVRDAVDAQVALYDAMPRDSWVEHRGQ
jgi:hypothetical protein